MSYGMGRPGTSVATEGRGRQLADGDPSGRQRKRERTGMRRAPRMAVALGLCLLISAFTTPFASAGSSELDRPSWSSLQGNSWSGTGGSIGTGVEGNSWSAVRPDGNSWSVPDADPVRADAVVAGLKTWSLVLSLTWGLRSLLAADSPTGSTTGAATGTPDGVSWGGPKHRKSPPQPPHKKQ